MPWTMIEVGWLVIIRAPARYSGTGGPGTLLMTTLATCGMRSATLALPYSAVAASISHGTPSDGKSVGRMLLRLPIVPFIAVLAAITWARRLAGSAMCVPRLIRLIEAWLPADVSSALELVRSEIGTAAIKLFLGRLRCLPNQRRSAPLHTASTMSLMVAPWARPMIFSSPSGSETRANARPSVTLALSTVRGASVRMPGRLPAWPLPPSSAEPAAARAAASFSVPTVEGSSRTMLAIFCACEPITPRSISVMSSLKIFGRPELCASIARGSADTSRIALASATAAWPSTAAWCSCEYIPTRLWPSAEGARPSKM